MVNVQHGPHGPNVVWFATSLRCHHGEVAHGAALLSLTQVLVDDVALTTQGLPVSPASKILLK